MAKQLNVNLAFTADTGKAKAQLQDLQNSLNQLMTSSRVTRGDGLGLTKDIVQATHKVAELQSMLEASKTTAGTLDLGKLNANLKSGGQSLSEYANSLRLLGNQGEQAFAKLAQSITMAEVPLKRTGGLMSSFATTLKNTVKWQISSSMLHNFIGTIHSAMGYAKELDSSLNHIRIVTQQSSEEMAVFAEQANKAARALSATTTEYTKAALIYYQQGLGDQEVADRVDVTLKMAHASGQSAEIVSDQMTAVWNNFYDGSQSLEHYADVMTALGAATASSTDEIAGGLEKFASVADMIGLSYEYAASALATITATTRQSEDVVGTALKTIFARIQGLNLGETLEDGTTLNKYSEALNKVGISIFEQNGELKKMDDILDDMGSKWKTLSKDQQVALAQSVAGVRQYNQLVSLMENWDFMQSNIDLSLNSEGTLQAQADIYAESWQAARDRVKAAAEDIYDSILDDEFFKELLNAFEKFLNVVGNSVDALGGLPGVLALASGLMFKMFGPEIIASIDRWGYNIKLRSKDGLNDIIDLRKKVNAEMRSMFVDSANAGVTGAVKADVYTQQANLQDTLLAKQQQMVALGGSLTETQKQYANQLLQINSLLGQNVIKVSEELEQQQLKTNELELQLQQFQAQIKAFVQAHPKQANQFTTNFDLQNVKNLQIEYGQLQTILSSISKNSDFSQTVTQLTAMKAAAEKANLPFDRLSNILKATGVSGKNAIRNMDDLIKAIEKASFRAGEQAQTAFDNLRISAEKAGLDMGKLNPILDQLQASFTKTGILTQEQIQLLKDYGLNVEFVEGKIKTLPAAVPTASQGFVALGRTLSTTAMAINAIKGIIDTWNNEDMTFGDKLLATFTSLGMILPMVTTAFNKQSLAQIAAFNSSIVASLGFTAEASAATAARIATAEFAKSLLIALGPIGAIVAAIIGITAVCKKYNEALQADEIAAKKAAEAQKRFSEAAKNAKDELNDIVSTFDEYDSLIKTLKECDEKTEDWEDALKNVNDKILEILNKYPDLLKIAGLFNDDGTFNIEVIEGYISDAENEANAAQMSSYQASASLSQAEAKAAKNSLINSFSIILGGYKYNKEDGTQEYLDYDEKSAITEELINAAEQGPKVLREKVEEVAGEFDIAGEALEKFIDILWSYNEQITDISNEQISANTQSEQTNRLMAGQVLGSDARDDQKQHWQEFYEYEKANYNLNDVDFNRFTSSTNKDLIQLVKDAGYNAIDLAENAVVKDKETGELQIQFKDGKKVLLDDTRLTAANNYAIKKANEATVTGEGIDGYSSTFDSLSSIGINLNKNIAPALANTLLANIDLTDVDEELKKKLAENTTVSDQTDIINDYLNKKDYNENKIETEDAAGESKAKELDLDIEEFKTYRDLLKDNIGNYEDNVKGINEVAIANKRLERGVETISKDWKKFDEIMSDSTSTDSEISKILPDIKAGLQDILNLDTEEFELLPPTFAQDNWNLIQDVINGVDGAVEELRTVAGQEILMTVEGAVDDGKLNSQIEDLHNKINNFDMSHFTVGVAIDPTEQADFYASCQDIINAAEMTSEQAQAYFGAMGYDVTFKNNPQKVTETAVDMEYSYEYDPTTGEPTYRKAIPKPRIVETTIDAPTIETITPNGSYGGDVNVETTAPSSSIEGTSGGGGGGGSKKKTPKAPKKSDTVERYKEINDSLDDLEDAYNDAAKAADRLFGGAKLNELKKQNKLILDQKKALEQKKEEALANLKIDKDALLLAAKNAGVNFQFDGDKITNYTEQMTMLHNQLEALYTAAGEELDEAEEEAINELQEKIEELKTAISAFEDTRELIEDLDNEIQDKFNEWQDNNYEQLQYKLELKIEIEDSQLRKLEYFLNKYSDNFYKMAETAALTMDQGDANKSKLGISRDNKNDLDEAYSAGEISQADYIDGLKNIRDSVYESLEALIEMDKQMLHFFEDTLAAGQEELADFTDHMEHLTGVFDHYLNLMDLLGNTKDYDGMGDFLEGKAQTIRDRLDVSQANYEILLEQEKEAEEAYKAALASGSDEEIEILKENWDAAVDAVDEAEEQMLSLTEEWVEAMKAVIDNNMAKISDELEQNLTNGMGFDYLMDQFDMLNTRQEEYLTRTNQIYETNKLMRTASKALDETDNKVAKQKLQNFINETKSLQENNELSKLELDIQQAKYDLLLAEIALEEAQNAKSTVRLQRDSEGNFGYVYTADQDAISDAQQQLEDAENRLYNISLEGQQEYTEKYLQAQQEMHGKLNDLWDLYYNQHAIDEEEYNRRMAEIQEQYCGPDGILTKYSELYNIAVQADTNATADNWTKQYGNMTSETDKWSKSVNVYIGQVNEQIEVWEEVQEQANADVKGALENTTGATKDLTDESENLKDMIEDEVLPAIENEYDEVREVTEAYGAQRKGIHDLIKEYERLIDVINEKIAAEARSAGTTTSPRDEEEETDEEEKPNENSDSSEAKAKDVTNEAKDLVTRIHTGEIGNSTDGWVNAAKDAGYSDEAIDLVRKALNDSKEGAGFDYDFQGALDLIAKYQTGGYTGAWGPEGKLAFLHEKELVLNQNDTLNLLKTMEFVKSIVKFIDSQASLNSLSSLSAYNSSMNNLNNSLDQHVEIHAEFPNAVDHSEIEEAFNNLINTASQYANRKL